MSKHTPKIIISTLTLSLVLASCGTPAVQPSSETSEIKTHTFSNGESFKYRELDGLIVTDDIIIGTREEFPNQIKEYEAALQEAQHDHDHEGIDKQGVGIIKSCLNTLFVKVCGDIRWKDGKIPYSVDNTFSKTEKQAIAVALADWNLRVSNVKWVYQPSAANRVAFTRETDPNACGHSQIGYKGGVQQLRLQCFSMGVIQHEMAHTAGVFHEQSRCDRDNFVTINWANINPDYAGNFNKMCGFGVNDYGTYNYNSVMHYPAKAFSINDKYTIVPKNGVSVNTIGQRTGLHAGDISTLNKMYDPSTVKNY